MPVELEAVPLSRPLMVLSVLQMPLMEFPPPVSLISGSVNDPFMEPISEPVSVTLELLLVTGNMVMCPCCVIPVRQFVPAGV